MFSPGKGRQGGCALAFCKYTGLYSRRAEDLGELRGQVESAVAGIPLGWGAEAAPKHLPIVAVGPCRSWDAA